MEDRIRSILSNLEAVREDLLAVSDDIWLDIDHNDSDALRRGVDAKVAYNEAMVAFSRTAAEVSRLVNEFAELDEISTPLEPGSSAERESRERIIRQLDQETPHSLSEDFRYKRPHAFKIQDAPFVETSTWSQVYETLCRYLSRRQPEVFRTLPDLSDFTSNRGNKYFSRSPDDLRISRDFGSGIYAETNLSANQLRDNMKRILASFDLPEKEFVVYLREDRDAPA